MAKVFGKFGKDLGYDVDKDNRISFIDTRYTKAINIAKGSRSKPRSITKHRESMKC